MNESLKVIIPIIVIILILGIISAMRNKETDATSERLLTTQNRELVEDTLVVTEGLSVEQDIVTNGSMIVNGQFTNGRSTIDGSRVTVGNSPNRGKLSIFSDATSTNNLSLDLWENINQYGFGVRSDTLSIYSPKYVSIFDSTTPNSNGAYKFSIDTTNGYITQKGNWYYHFNRNNTSLCKFAFDTNDNYLIETSKQLKLKSLTSDIQLDSNVNVTGGLSVAGGNLGVSGSLFFTGAELSNANLVRVAVSNVTTFIQPGQNQTNINFTPWASSSTTLTLNTATKQSFFYGDILTDNVKPISFGVYNLSSASGGGGRASGIINTSTGVSSSTYTAVIAGYNGRLDVYEPSTSNNGVFMSVNGGVWFVNVGLSADDSSPETYSVRVMFIKNNLCDQSGSTNYLNL